MTFINAIIGGIKMDQTKLLKQTIDFHRNAFNNVFQALVLLQDQAERVSSTLLTQTNMLPEESKNTIGTWTENYKREQEKYKETVNAGFNQIEGFLGATN
jgi:hypothetical protein